MSFVYYKYDNVLADDVVNKILQLDDGNWQKAETDHQEKELLRKNEVIFSNDQWLYDIFWGVMEDANARGEWNLQIDCAEDFQLGKYSEGGHYEFHADGDGLMTINNPNNKVLHGKARKISMVAWLNEDFEGGEFEFHTAHMGKDRFIKPTKGTVMFFPSWILHKVHPVIKGTRYSLVSWFNGNPVK